MNMNMNEMQFLKLNQEIETEFSFFDECLQDCAVANGFDFQNKVGTARGRSLRRKSDTMLVAIDLLLRDSITEIAARPDQP